MKNNVVLDARTVSDHFPGIGRYVVNLSQALVRIDPGLDLVLLHDPSAASTRLALPGLPRIACPVSPFSPRQQWVVPAQLRRVQAALYHSPYYLMPYLPGMPTVLTCYDMIPLVYPAYFSPVQRLIYRLAHSLAFRAAAAILSISQSTKADIVRYFGLDPRRVVVTPLAAGEHFCPQPAGRVDVVRQKYGLPQAYALYLGSNKPHKNLARLVEGWKEARFRFQVSGFRLVIAGHWEERYPEAKRRVEELGLGEQVIFVGAVDDEDLPALYSGAALFAFPSEYEGFGLPVLEAMACGSPVVCSNTSSLPEVAGEVALLVDPTDVDALAAAIGRVLADVGLRQAMREKGLAQAARFSWERTARETLAVYASATHL
ncbi:MAG: glycosyltransferase family 4 protein [Thermoflexales bacterium]|nr:glycosyltransferase family 4 protein [Thermoflexales bacterium]